MNTSLIINFGTAVLTFVFGLLLLLGIIYPGRMDSSKLMFGIILVVYGVYRFINSISKIKQQKQEDRRQKLSEERDKLMNNE